MSDTKKIHIDVNLVRQLITTQFPQWADLPITPVAHGGWDNRTFHLGEHMTVRLPSAAHYAAKVKIEQLWLPRIAPHLPLPIPTPVAMGSPSKDYPWQWSIYRWIDGETASTKNVQDLSLFAKDLVHFLKALHKIDTTGGPVAGPHNFYRGGPLATYNAETREAISILGEKIDTKVAQAVWETALSSQWSNTPVWVHGDVAVGNLLVKNGRLAAIIDFGGMGIGDPACDVAIAWTLFEGKSRETFRLTLSLDNATWSRGRGWALWKALIVCAALPGTNNLELEKSKHVLDEVLTDYLSHHTQ